jgi:hypothetical protein
MANVQGIEFSSNQSELVKSLIRNLQTNITKYSQQELLQMISLWRKEVSHLTPKPPFRAALANAAWRPSVTKVA